VVAVGHEQRVEALGRAVVERQLPGAVAQAPSPAHERLEADAVAEAEVVDVGVEVAGDLRVVRVVRIGLGHREVRVLHPVARGVDVQLPVGRRHAVAIAEDPVAADAIRCLEACVGNAALVEGLGGGDSR
jgi:hypothetical protein